MISINYLANLKMWSFAFSTRLAMTTDNVTESVTRNKADSSWSFLYLTRLHRSSRQWKLDLPSKPLSVPGHPMCPPVPYVSSASKQWWPQCKQELYMNSLFCRATQFNVCNKEHSLLPRGNPNTQKATTLNGNSPNLSKFSSVITLSTTQTCGENSINWWNFPPQKHAQYARIHRLPLRIFSIPCNLSIGSESPPNRDVQPKLLEESWRQNSPHEWNFPTRLETIKLNHITRL